MKQSLQLKIGQNLTMTPQLQQAIRLLQLSTLELQTEVQNALESNPMLEQEEGEQADETEADARLNSEAGESRQNAEGDNELIPDELPTDSNWEDVFDTGTTNFSAPDIDNTRDPFDTIRINGEGLHEHLFWQLELANFSDSDRIIAELIIDSIDADGYLKTSTAELLSQLEDELEVDADEIEAVLHRIQQFDPVGIAATGLRESLRLQLRQFDPATPWLEEARTILRDHFDLLGSHDYVRLGRKLKLAADDLQHAILLIQSLNPRPGSLFSNMEPEYIIPDVYVVREKGHWKVRLNTESLPKLRINAMYAKLVKRGSNSKDNNFLRDNLQEARWFLKSLQSRHETLLKVANCIVEHQQDFFELGEEAMKPMVLRSIADIIEMHESTVSRVTTRKYMHTPRGIYEFKYFFSSHVSTDAGGECSATAVRAIIKKLVAAENPAKPLSDSKIANIIAGQGINVARRTIAKYRESLSISPSNERKRLA